MIAGEGHLRHLCDEFLAHYHTERSHQGIGNVPPVHGPDPPATLPFPARVDCLERFGGLLKHYVRAAA